MNMLFVCVAYIYARKRSLLKLNYIFLSNKKMIIIACTERTFLDEKKKFVELGKSSTAV